MKRTKEEFDKLLNPIKDRVLEGIKEDLNIDAILRKLTMEQLETLLNDTTVAVYIACLIQQRSTKKFKFMEDQIAEYVKTLQNLCFYAQLEKINHVTFDYTFKTFTEQKIKGTA